MGPYIDQHDTFVLRQLAKPFEDDMPDVADTHEVELRDGDIIVVFVRFSS